jgi:S-adenosylmethionine:tRNA ribosyltransferase-isomerase
MKISLFNYKLPSDLIAQTPIYPRESANLMVLSKNSGAIKHQKVINLPQFINPGDVIVINNTKVFKARLLGSIDQPDGNPFKVELFLIRPEQNNTWLAIGKPGRKFKPGHKIIITDNLKAEIISYHPDGTMNVSFHLKAAEVIQLANIYGHVPVPPYIKQEPDTDLYQTSFAKVYGSVAAPTAGFHLTEKIRNLLLNKGVEILEITLHVGLGTFLPVKTSDINAHHMHAEWAEITQSVCNRINLAINEKRRIIAIGTTTVRTLEGVALLNHGKLTQFSGDINIFIKPGFKYQIIDAMLTNFHLPKSTLLILVSAFAGRKIILNAYDEAIKNNYRFFSFGDAMLII